MKKIKVMCTEPRLVPTEGWQYPMRNEEFKKKVHGYCEQHGMLKKGVLHTKTILSGWGPIATAVYQDRGFIVGLTVNLETGNSEFVVVPDTGEIPNKTYQDFSELCDGMFRVYFESQHNLNPEAVVFQQKSIYVVASNYGKATKENRHGNN